MYNQPQFHCKLKNFVVFKGYYGKEISNRSIL